jgi:hypothetical protein
MRNFTRVVAFAIAIALLPLPMQAQATAQKYSLPFEPLPEGEIERLDAPYLNAMKDLSLDSKARIKDMEIAFMKTLIPPAEAINLSERLRICRTRIDLPAAYDQKIERIHGYSRKTIAEQTKTFFDDKLFTADYIDPRVLRDHLLADQMVQLQVNQNVIIASLGNEKFDAPSCYRLRDKIDQYLIDNDIRTGNTATLQ